jgi:tetratricopeptide (TPR) repeat protein
MNSGYQPEPSKKREPLHKEPTFTQLQAEYYELLQREDFQTALTVANSAFELAKKDFYNGDLRILDAGLTVGKLALLCQKVALAEDAYRFVMDQLKTHGNTQTDMLCVASFALAEITRRDGRYVESYQLADQSLTLAISSTAMIDAIPQIEICLSAAAHLQGKSALGAKHFEDLTAELELTSGKVSLHLCHTLLEIAQTYGNRLMPTLGLPCLELAKDIIKKFDHETSPLYLNILELYSQTLVLCGHLDDALNACSERIAIIEESFDVSPEVLQYEKIKLLELWAEKGEHEYVKNSLNEFHHTSLSRGEDRQQLFHIKELIIEQNVMLGRVNEALESIRDVCEELVQSMPEEVRTALSDLENISVDSVLSIIWGLPKEQQLETMVSLRILASFLGQKLSIYSEISDQDSISAQLEAHIRLEEILGSQNSQAGKEACLETLNYNPDQTERSISSIERKLLQEENQHNFVEVSVRINLSKLLVASDQHNRALEQQELLNNRLDMVPGISISTDFSDLQFARANLALSLGDRSNAQRILESELDKYSAQGRRYALPRLKILLELSHLIKDEYPEQAHTLILEARHFRDHLMKMNPGLFFDIDEE